MRAIRRRGEPGRSRTGPRRRQDGIALLLAVMVLAILGIVVMQMSVTSLHTKTVAENQTADLQNTCGVRAGYAQALLYLQSDFEQGADVDSLGERWARPIEFDLGKARVRVTIQDSERFVSLAQLVDEKGEPIEVVVAQLRRLVRILLHPAEVADRIIDYIDADSKGAFEARAKNDRLFNLEELLRIEGILPEVVYGGVIGGEEKKGLASFTTAWPPTPPKGGAPGVVNINTASSEVLQSLADQMTPQLAEAVVAYRQTPGADGRPQAFQKTEDLKKVPGLGATVFDAVASQISVKSSTFEIRVRSQVGNLEKAWVYVVQRTEGSLKLLASQRLNDFMTVKPVEVRP